MIMAIDTTNIVRLFFDTGINALGVDVFWSIFFGMIALIILMGTVKSNIEGATVNGLTAYFIIVAAACGLVLAPYAMFLFAIGAGLGVAMIIKKNVGD